MDISSIASRPVATAPGGGTRGLGQAVFTTSSFEAQKTAAAEADAATQAPSSEHVAQAVNQVNDAFTQNGQDLHAFIEIDKAANIQVIKVQDKTTGEVISQFPSKAVIAMAESISQFLEKKGQMMNVRA